MASNSAQTATPGPWKIDGDRDQDFGLCVVQESTGGIICSIESTPGYGTADELNAQLIAAAPDLLDALKELVAVSDLRGDAESINPGDDPKLWTSRRNAAWEEVKKAIAKAEGR